MFNSSKMSNSPRTSNINLYNTINETCNGISRSFIQPKITSTPLIKRESIFATPPKHNILSPKRYSLSEIATPPRTNRDLTKVNTTGPLLASTRYNVNVSTYEDTKSPGLASRIVQYNEEMERERELSHPPTHQTKYGSPGLFPVVHLFKKKLPALEQKPRRVTIRIASPEISKHHSQDYNRKLLEGIVKPTSQMSKGSPFSSPSSQPSSSTRSVLDALKEISRKRIHANEEYDMNEDSGKRLRIMNNGESNKRLRDDSSLDKSPSPSKRTSKRVCMYDEYAASCSSMDFSFKKSQQPIRKSISISTLTETPKESPPIKLINAETQTSSAEVVDDSELASKTDKEENENKTQNSEESVKKNSTLKIFDDAPLERIRKNRLAALMGSLTGKEPVLLPKPDYASVLNSVVDTSSKPSTTTSETLKSSEKPLVSILSSPNKISPTKSNKHVHFSVPESTSQTNINPAPTVSFPVASTSITAPVSSASEINMSFGSCTNTTPETPAPPSSPVGLQPSSTVTTTTTSPVIFNSQSGTNLRSATSIISKESSASVGTVDTPKTSFAIPNFQFKPPTTSATALGITSTPVSNSIPTSQLSFPMNETNKVSNSPPKMGGFKFDLSKPVITSAGSTATYSFGNTSQSNASKPSSELAVIPTSSKNTQGTTHGTFNFIANATASTINTFSTGPTFGIATTVPSSTVSTTPTFKFGSVANGNKSASSAAAFPLAHSNTTNFEASNISAPAPSAFGTNTSTSTQMSGTPVPSAPAFGTSKTPLFSFGPPKTTSAATSFGVSVNTTSTPSGFGVPVNTATMSSGFGVTPGTSAPISFGSSSTLSNFGTSTSTPNSNFLNTSASLPPAGFGVPTTTSALGNGFGSPATTSISGFSSPPMFGATKAAPFGVTTNATSFGTASTANSSPFGKSSTSQFVQNTTQPAFGIPPTTTVSFGTANAFAGSTTTTPSVFVGNNSSVFGTKGNGFGATSNNTNIFGGTVNTQPSGFGATTAKPLFTPATTSPFGTATNTTTTASFGSNNTPSFSFGAKTTASSSVGTGNAFGTTTTTSTAFGTSAPPAFGASNSFGGTTNFGNSNAFEASSAPVFGVPTTNNQPNSFGTTNPPNFGTPNTGFNTGDKGSVFGNSSVTPSFGVNNTPSPFGGSTSGFGTPNSTSGFGTSTGVSAFAKPQPQNVFVAPAPNTFGTANNFGATQPQAPNFGSTNTSNTQNNAVFSFGATTTPKPPGVFSFGATATNDVPKPTFNFTGGSTTAPAFGSSGTPFGSTGPAPFGSSGIPQFNAPQAGTQGMFSIGSGSSTGKARTHLKPKRRT